MRVGEKAPTVPVDWGNRDSRNRELSVVGEQVATVAVGLGGESVKYSSTLACGTKYKHCIPVAHACVDASVLAIQPIARASIKNSFGK